MKKIYLISLVLFLTLSSIINSPFAQSSSSPTNDARIPPISLPANDITQTDSAQHDIALFYTPMVAQQLPSEEQRFLMMLYGVVIYNRASPYPINVTGVYEIPGYIEKASILDMHDDFTFGKGAMSMVEPKLDVDGADGAVLFVWGGDDAGGVSWQWLDIDQNFRDWSYAAVHIQYAHYLSAHEVGHFLGASHPTDPGMFEYSHAWDDGEVCTLMCVSPRTPEFSNPSGYGDADHNNYGTIQQSAPVAATWRSTMVTNFITLTTSSAPPGPVEISGSLRVPWSFVDVSVDSGTTWTEATVSDTTWAATITIPFGTDYVDLSARVNAGQSSVFTLPVAPASTPISGTATSAGRSPNGFLQGASIRSSYGPSTLTDANGDYTLLTWTGEQTLTLLKSEEISPTMGIRYYMTQTVTITGPTTVDFVGVPGVYFGLHKVYLPVVFNRGQ